jgi:adenylosuccinate synthase
MEILLYVQDLSQLSLCREKLQWLWELKLERAEKAAANIEACNKLLNTLRRIDLDVIAERYLAFTKQVKLVSTDEVLSIIRKGQCVFEGAQGVMIDQNAGFFPHVTKSNTTFANAMELLCNSGFTGEVTRFGLLRGYCSRHGAGPFVTEDPALNLSPCHNATNQWQGNFRLGWFDTVAARYAIEAAGGVDQLAITNLDRMNGLENVRICNAYTGPFSEEFFWMKGKKIQSLRVLNKPTAKTHTARTQLVKECKPVYLDLKGWQDQNSGKFRDYLFALESSIGHRIRAISVSPTAEGKFDFSSRQDK